MNPQNSFYRWLLSKYSQQEPKLDGAEPDWDAEDEYTIRTIDPEEFPLSDARYNLPTNLPSKFFLKFHN